MRSGSPALELHPFRHADAEEVETLGQHARGGVAEQKAGIADGLFGLQHGAALEERVEFAGEFVEVIAEEIWPAVVEDRREDFAELCELFHEGKLGRLRELDVGRWTLDVGRSFLRLAEDRADADVAVLQIRRGVALEAEHFLP